MKWRKKGEKQAKKPEVLAVQTAWEEPFAHFASCAPAGTGERRLYAALRENIPIIDAAIDKILRLVGSFEILCNDKNNSYQINQFLQNVKVNALECGIQSFLNSYLSQLLTFGNAIGEIVLTTSGEIGALYNASLDDVELRECAPLSLSVCRREAGQSVPVRYPELVVASALNPPPGCAKGVSLLHGLPFVSGILMQIYRTIGTNWERLGDVRFAVTYKPSNDATDRAFAKDRAKQIAQEWSRAMRKDCVSDFVAVGDVTIKAIGADNQILDSNVPVRQMLEEIVAKMGIPPFLLGLSWSSTERMSSQQADILTSELEAYRRLLNPVIEKICALWMRLHGLEPKFTIEWDTITLQDAVDLADARLMNAQAAQIEETCKQKEAV